MKLKISIGLNIILSLIIVLMIFNVGGSTTNKNSEAKLITKSLAKINEEQVEKLAESTNVKKTEKQKQEKKAKKAKKKVVKKIVIPKDFDISKYKISKTYKEKVKKNKENEDYFPFTLIAQNGKHKYYISHFLTRWNEAKTLSEKFGGHLVTITNKQENTIIWNGLKENKNAYNVWIGLTEQNEDNEWKWITGENFDYQAWSINQPDDGAIHSESKQDYAVISNVSPPARWNDMDRWKICAFVMEIE